MSTTAQAVWWACPDCEVRWRAVLAESCWACGHPDPQPGPVLRVTSQWGPGATRMALNCVIT